MSYTKERDEFIAIATAEGLSVEAALLLLRYATTLERLAVAQCNGAWPADNGERATVVCPNCASCFAPSSLRRSSETKGLKICQDCRTAELIRACLPEGYHPIINGDPRGAVLKIGVPSGKTNDWGREGIYVPTRG